MCNMPTSPCVQALRMQRGSGSGLSPQDPLQLNVSVVALPGMPPRIMSTALACPPDGSPCSNTAPTAATLAPTTSARAEQVSHCVAC